MTVQSPVLRKPLRQRAALAEVDNRGDMTASKNVSLGNKIAYGFGSVAFGVKNNGFDYFF